MNNDTSSLSSSNTTMDHVASFPGAQKLRGNAWYVLFLHTFDINASVKEVDSVYVLSIPP